MDINRFIENMAIEVETTVKENNKDLSYVNELLKWGTDSQKRMAALIITSAAKEVVAKKFDGATSQQIISCENLINTFGVRRNCLNTMNAVHDEPGLVYFSSFCEFAVCDECIELADEEKEKLMIKAQQEKQKLEEKNKKGLISRLFSKKHIDEENL